MTDTETAGRILARVRARGPFWLGAHAALYAWDGDPGRPEPEVDRCNRHPVGPLHPARRAGPCPFRQRVPEFIARAVREWIAAVGARTAFIEPGSPWENGYCESFNSKLRDELLNGEVFYSLAEARIVIESWRQHYNTQRPHSTLGYGRPHRPPCCGRLRRAHQPWPLSPPCIKVDPGHQMGAGHHNPIP